MVNKYDWLKDALIPFFIAVGIILAFFLGGIQGIPPSIHDIAAQSSGGLWTALIWLAMLAVSCIASSLGAVLRHFDNNRSIYFEFPGVVFATFGTLAYAIAIAAVHLGEPRIILTVAIAAVLGIHFLFRVIVLIRTIKLEQKLFTRGE